jgi:hypothetical protein
MPQPCLSCARPDREQLDDALRAAAETDAVIAVRFGVSPKAISRHRSRHLSRRPASGPSPVLGQPSEKQPERIDLLPREDFVQAICYATGRNRGGNTPVDPKLPAAAWDDLVAAGRHEQLTRFPGCVYDAWLALEVEARKRA